MISLTPQFLALVKKILKDHVPGREVRVFGSRATAQIKPYSDLDLVIMGSVKCCPKRLYALKDAFEESNLPFQVNVLDWNAISPSFRAVIEKKYSVIQRDTSS